MLQEMQAPIDRRIVNALVEATPDNWSAFRMDAVVQAGTEYEKCSIDVESLEGLSEPIAPTDELQAAVLQLVDCFRTHGKPLCHARYDISLLKSGQWKFEASFGY